MTCAKDIKMLGKNNKRFSCDIVNSLNVKDFINFITYRQQSNPLNYDAIFSSFQRVMFANKYIVFKHSMHLNQ